MNTPLKLLFAGDVMIGRFVNECLKDESPAYPWGNTLPLFLNADWRACNLECVISDHGTPWARTPKTFYFRSDARNTAVLKSARMDVVSMANNHTLDFNHRGMVEMIRLLDGAEIGHCGVGLDLAEASRLVIREVKGVRIGMLSFTDNEPAWEATDDHPGVYYVPVENPDERTANLLNLVKASRSKVDLLVVSAHWGGNWGYSPSEAHVELAHELVRAGAGILFGHSAHVCRGVEVFENGLILYSAGDFVDDYRVDAIDRNDQSWAFEVLTRGGKLTGLNLYPIVIRNCQASLAGKSVAADMMETMERLCEAFGTAVAKSPDQSRLVIDMEHSARVRTEYESKTMATV